MIGTFNNSTYFSIYLACNFQSPSRAVAEIHIVEQSDPTALGGDIAQLPNDLFGRSSAPLTFPEIRAVAEKACGRAAAAALQAQHAVGLPRDHIPSGQWQQIQVDHQILFVVAIRSQIPSIMRARQLARGLPAQLREILEDVRQGQLQIRAIDPEAAQAALDDLDRRWRCSGLVASSMARSRAFSASSAA